MGCRGAVVILVGGGTAAATCYLGHSHTTTTASPVTITDENVKASSGTMTQTVSGVEPTPADDDTLTFAVPGTWTAVDYCGQKGGHRADPRYSSSTPRPCPIRSS